MTAHPEIIVAIAICAGIVFGIGITTLFLMMTPLQPKENSDDITINRCASDVDLLDWLDSNGSVNYTEETARISFDIPDDFQHGSIREIIRAAKYHQETQP